MGAALSRSGKSLVWRIREPGVESARWFPSARSHTRPPRSDRKPECTRGSGCVCCDSPLHSYCCWSRENPSGADVATDHTAATRLMPAELIMRAVRQKARALHPLWKLPRHQLSRLRRVFCSLEQDLEAKRSAGSLLAGGNSPPKGSPYVFCWSALTLIRGSALPLPVWRGMGDSPSSA